MVGFLTGLALLAAEAHCGEVAGLFGGIDFNGFDKRLPVSESRRDKVQRGLPHRCAEGGAVYGADGAGCCIGKGLGLPRMAYACRCAAPEQAVVPQAQCHAKHDWLQATASRRSDGLQLAYG